MSRASASIYFGFNSKYINGAVSLYHDVLTGALGTASLSGLLRVFVQIIDKSMEKLEKYTEKRKLEITTLGWSGVGLAKFCELIGHNFSNEMYTTINNGTYVVGIFLTIVLWILPWLRRGFGFIFRSFDYSALIVAGVTGNSYVESLTDTGVLLGSNTATIVLAMTTTEAFTRMARIGLPSLVLVFSYVLAQELDYFMYSEQFGLGLIAAGAYVTISIDTLQTAIYSSLVCVLLQTNKDKGVSAGSPAANRKRSAVEMQTLKILNMVPEGALTCIAEDDKDEKMPPTTPTRSRTPSKSSSSTNRARSKSVTRAKRGTKKET